MAHILDPPPKHLLIRVRLTDLYQQLTTSSAHPIRFQCSYPAMSLRKKHLTPLTISQ